MQKKKKYRVELERDRSNKRQTDWRRRRRNNNNNTRPGRARRAAVRFNCRHGELLNGVGGWWDRKRRRVLALSRGTLTTNRVLRRVLILLLISRLYKV